MSLAPILPPEMYVHFLIFCDVPTLNECRAVSKAICTMIDQPPQKFYGKKLIELKESSLKSREQLLLLQQEYDNLMASASPWDYLMSKIPLFGSILGYQKEVLALQNLAEKHTRVINSCKKIMSLRHQQCIVYIKAMKQIELTQKVMALFGGEEGFGQLTYWPPGGPRAVSSHSHPMSAEKGDCYDSFISLSMEEITAPAMRADSLSGRVLIVKDSGTYQLFFEEYGWNSEQVPRYQNGAIVSTLPIIHSSWTHLTPDLFEKEYKKLTSIVTKRSLS